MSIDPKTGREFGDHGSADQAVVWALDHSPSWGTEYAHAFLWAWREGDLAGFPDYYAWLKEQPE
jgi:hypothetical protein